MVSLLLLLRNSFYCLLLSLLVLFSSQAEKDYRIQAHRTYEKIEIDGYFSEPDWQLVQSVGNFIQVEPNPGEFSTQEIEVL